MNADFVPIVFVMCDENGDSHNRDSGRGCFVPKALSCPYLLELFRRGT